MSMNKEDEEGDVFVDAREELEPDTRSYKQRNPITPVEGTTTCKNYDIIPYVACIHSGPVHCVDFSWGLKWMFTGGADGFIRRYNFYDSVNGKMPLTVAQRHPFVDTITKSGVAVSYWENEQPVFQSEVKLGKDNLYEPKVSPVYSLAVQSEALWILGGLESGGINLQTVRHNEGQIQSYMHKHSSAVSVLKLDSSETRFLSGSWDKNVIEWDLDTGKVVREYTEGTSQVSAIEWQPVGGAIVSPKLMEQVAPPTSALREKDDDEKSLDSLFGGDEDEDPMEEDPMAEPEQEQPVEKVSVSESTFLAAAIDGSVNIWDRRQRQKTGHLQVPDGTPPWCMSACWSTDGNSVFVGRRNNSVNEYDIRKSVAKPARTLKFPTVSGPVSTVAAMPSGRHVMCGSHDNMRLYDLQSSTSKSKTPFYIVPGHHGAVLSSIWVDPSCQYLVTASGSRGWQGNSTDVALVYEIKPSK